MTGTLPTADRLNARQFHIAVRRLADSLSYGTDRSPFLGSGIEYAQSRPYQYGDSVRLIDWRVTARVGAVYVKEYEAPKSLPCHLLIDTSASMTVGSTPRTKYALAVHVAGGLAFAALDRVSPVGIMGVGGRELRVVPTMSRDQVLRWLHLLRTFRYDEETAIGKRVAALAPSLGSRCLVIVLSDLQDPAAVPALKLLAQRHDVIVLQVRDPAEQGVPGGGLLLAGEAETGRLFIARSGKRFLDPDAHATELKKSGVDHLVLRTDLPFAAELRAFFKARGGLGGKRG